MEEMSSMTKKNADNAGQAKAIMGDARLVVEKVGGHMEEMSKAIVEITITSEETSKIIKTIDEIAFQTNLLALNAAVEAARAGEAGAGFAVVADEVRNLALRAAEAAKNTNNLIENTLRAVQKGSELTKKTQEVFKEKIAISGKVGQLIDEIDTASQEQARGISQVNIAVAEMDKVTQQVAASAEESASASEELNAQAQQMKDYVEDLNAVVGGSSQKSIGHQTTSLQGREAGLHLALDS
jgi:methyl-accepting chemotaxis protein